MLHNGRPCKRKAFHYIKSIKCSLKLCALFATNSQHLALKCNIDHKLFKVPKHYLLISRHTSFNEIMSHCSKLLKSSITPCRTVSIHYRSSGTCVSSFSREAKVTCSSPGVVSPMPCTVFCETSLKYPNYLVICHPTCLQHL